jgi:hypothetical protein
VGEDAVVNALAEMEVLFQREADGSLLNLTEAGPLLLLDDGFGGEILYFRSVFRIHDILVWIRIRIRGSVPLTNGSGSRFVSGSCFFRH